MISVQARVQVRELQREQVLRAQPELRVQREQQVPQELRVLWVPEQPQQQELQRPEQGLLP